MTSVGAKIENQDQFMPIFKVKGQIYHKAGSLLPFSGENHKFLQLYFISDSNSELNERCGISPDVERTIVSQLQHLLHENNDLVRLFKTAIDLMPNDTQRLLFTLTKRLLVKMCIGEHERSPAVVHLAVHLQNGQHVYFLESNVQQRALNPPDTTLTAFFSLC